MNDKKYQKAIELQEFIKNYIPKGWRESIGTCMFSPSITEHNYIVCEKAFND
jgi:hypothetical protein